MNRWRRAAADAGMVTAFVVIFVTTALLVVGLVLDGGYMLAAKRKAINEAESAARAGAQEVSIDAVRRGGAPELDASAAEARAEAFLAQRGLDGHATVSGDRVTVTVSIEHAPLMLGFAGVGNATLTGTGTARAAQGAGGP